MINEKIATLVEYGIKKGFYKEQDRVYITNKLLDILRLDEYSQPENIGEDFDLESTLKAMLDFAVEKGIITETQYAEITKEEYKGE